MKAPLTLSLVLLAALAAQASDINPARLQKVVDAIYLAEGGAKAKVPYGILSVKVRSKEHARQVCERTVRNNWRRWEDAGRPGDFISFLGARYCPPSTDPVGHVRWVRNVTAISSR